MKNWMMFFLGLSAIFTNQIWGQNQTDTSADEIANLSKCQFDTTRDWTKYPVIVKINDPSRPLYAVGDIHGSFDEFYTLLTKAGIIKGSKPADPYKFEWIAGKAILVTTGDAINKGENTNDVVHFLMQLQNKAEQAGGMYIHVFGNHEMGLLIDAKNKNQSFKNGKPIYGPSGEKYQVLISELQQKGIDPCSFISPATKTGAWLRNLPAAAIVNGIYLSHSGWANRMSPTEITNNFKEMVKNNDWGNPLVCGSSKTPIGGLVNSDAWWQSNTNEFSANLNSLGVKQVFFGHDPKGFGHKGHILAYELGPVGSGQVLVKLDVGLVTQHSRGEIIRCRAKHWSQSGGCQKLEVLSRGKADKATLASETSLVSVEASSLSSERPTAEKDSSRCKGISNTHGEFVELPICRNPPMEEPKARTSC